MTTMASQITSLTVVHWTVYSDADQRKHQSSALLAFVWGIHLDRWIPRTKGQLRGKCFHLMTSSWQQALVATSAVCIHLVLAYCVSSNDFRRTCPLLSQRNLNRNFIHFHSRKCIWKYPLQNGGDIFLASIWLSHYWTSFGPSCWEYISNEYTLGCSLFYGFATFDFTRKIQGTVPSLTLGQLKSGRVCVDNVWPPQFLWNDTDWYQ